MSVTVPLRFIVMKDGIGGTMQCDTVYRYPKLLRQVVSEMAKRIDGVDYICAVESKGYLIASALSYECGIPLIMAKKRWSCGKHDNFVSAKYVTGHSQGELEMLNMSEYEGKNVMIIDDIVESGNTATAVVNMLKECKFDRIDMMSIVRYGSDEELSIENLNSFYSIFQYDINNPNARLNLVVSLD